MKQKMLTRGARSCALGCSPDAPSTTTVGTTVSPDVLTSAIAAMWRFVPQLCPVRSNLSGGLALPTYARSKGVATKRSTRSCCSLAWDTTLPNAPRACTCYVELTRRPCTVPKGSF